MSDQRHRTTIEIAVDDGGVAKLGQTVQQALDPQTVALFTQAVDRTSGAVGQLQAAFERQERAREMAAAHRDATQDERRETAKVERVAREKARAESKAADDQAREQAKHEKEHEQRQQEYRQKAMAFAVGTAGLIGAAASGGFTSALASAIPVIGPAASGLLSGIQGFYQEFVQAQTSNMRAMGPSGVDASKIDSDQFTRYGMGPGEAAGSVAALAGRSGREGAGLTGILPTQLRLQNLLGVQGAAGVVGAEESSGGRSANASKLMLEAVSTGLEAGIRTTRLDAYLGNISGWVEQVRAQGIDFSSESALQLVRGFHSLGPAFAGEAAALRARQLPEAMKNAAKQGGIGGAISFEAARQTLGPGANIVDLMELTEGGGTKEQAAMFQRKFLELVKRGSGDDVLGIKYLLDSVGMQMSIPQLKAIANGDLSGITDARADTEAATQKMGGRQGMLDKMGAAPRFAADHQFRRTALGGQEDVGGAARNIMSNDLEMAKSVITMAAPLIEKVTALAKALLTGDIVEPAKNALNDVGKKVGLPKLGSDWAEGIKDGTLGALREFFAMDTFKVGFAKVVASLVEGSEESDALIHTLRNSKPKKGAVPAGTDADGGVPAAAPASGGGASSTPAADPSMGPQGALMPGTGPRMLRDAARLLEGAATEFERSMRPSDGSLGFG